MNDWRSIGLSFAAALASFVFLDAVWLTQVGLQLFRAELSSIFRAEPWLSAVAAFYVVYAIGIVVLAVRPALASRSPSEAAVNGAVLGLTAYATFDLTNLAVINGWTMSLAAIDMAWGVVATALASMAGYAVGASGEDRS